MERIELGPSVKGSVFLIAVQGVKRLIERGQLSREEIECRLEASDHRYLEEKILLADWYPVTAFDSLSQISLNRLGQSESEFFVHQGENAARHLLGGEVHEQFAHVMDKRGDDAVRSMLTVARLIFNFSHWVLLDDGSGDLGHFEVEVSEADDMPEVLRYAAQGFIKYVASLVVGSSVKVVSQRPSSDVILYSGCPAG
jgi:hypothetical protein